MVSRPVTRRSRRRPCRWDRWLAGLAVPTLLFLRLVELAIEAGLAALGAFDPNPVRAAVVAAVGPLPAIVLLGGLSTAVAISVTEVGAGIVAWHPDGSARQAGVVRLVGYGLYLVTGAVSLVAQLGGASLGPTTVMRAVIGG